MFDRVQLGRNDLSCETGVGLLLVCDGSVQDLRGRHLPLVDHEAGSEMSALPENSPIDVRRKCSYRQMALPLQHTQAA